MADDDVYNLTGLPKPKNYDKLKAEGEKQKAEENNQIPESGKKVSEGKKEDDPKDLSDRAHPNLWFKLRNNLADFFDPAR